MNPLECYIDAFKNYFNFKDRTKRRTFWYYQLINSIIVFVLGIISAGVLSIVYGLIITIPGFALGARRLHDTGKSGWWQLLYIIPILGLLILIFLFIQKSQDFENEYGKVN